MKTRIISGVVAALLLVAVLTANFYFPLTIVFVLALLSAIASYEILKETGLVKNPVAIAAACLYSAVVQLAYAGLCRVSVVTLFYAMAIVLVSIWRHSEFGAKEIAVSLGFPIALGYAFYCLGALLSWQDGMGLFYFGLLLIFSCVSDIFAYFVGSAIGRHKMAPVISPKKSYEGLLGGIIGAMLVMTVTCLVMTYGFSFSIKMWLLVALTPVFCLIGVVGDLFASAIKRDCGIKDYGRIMPGHGGVLDRLDSVLMISPFLALFISYISVIG